jgi:HAD superfamily hydrolase (TIGR01509 family)
VLTRYRALKNELTDASASMPGVDDAFAAISEAGRRSAVASSSSIGWVERHLKRLDLWTEMSAVATRTDVGVERTKPAPDLFLLAADRAGVSPAECLVIEDSRHGVRGAKAAGMTVVAVPNRITTGQDFEAADQIVGSVAEIDLAGIFASD